MIDVTQTRLAERQRSGVRSATDSASEIELARSLESITDRLLAGDAIDAQRLLAEHPQYADKLAELLPTIHAVAQVGQASELPLRVPAEGRSGEGGERGDGEDSSADNRTLGDFRILREIGRGGMGVVYEAEQLSLGRRVALKVLPFAAMLDARQLQRFKNEARAAATLQHPGIVPVFSVGCERGVHFYAMQYIEGQTLAEVIEAMKGEGRSTKDETTTPLPPGEGRVRGSGEDLISDAIAGSSQLSMASLSNSDDSLRPLYFVLLRLTPSPSPPPQRSTTLPLPPGEGGVRAPQSSTLPPAPSSAPSPSSASKPPKPSTTPTNSASSTATSSPRTS